MDELLLTEDDVIDAVCEFLEGRGYEIAQRARTTQRGIDIVARKSSARPRELYVEAKGATSARAGSARFGRPFDSAQVSVHVAEAFYTAAVATTRNAQRDEVLSAMALPDNDLHRKFVRGIQPVLDRLKIGVFWVSPSKEVRLESRWEL